MKRNITLDGPPHATGERVTPTTRELAQRLSGTDEILLLWHVQTERVELSVSTKPPASAFTLRSGRPRRSTLSTTRTPTPQATKTPTA
jgi:hypothetical protein